MTEKVRSRVHAAELGFLQKVRGLFRFEKVKSTDIRQSLNIKPLLIRVERSQLRSYGHATRMFTNKQQSNQWLLFQMAKGLEGDLELAGGIMLKA